MTTLSDKLKSIEPKKDFLLLQEMFSNRALYRSYDEKWEDDINGNPREGWNNVVDRESFERMRDIAVILAEALDKYTDQDLYKREVGDYVPCVVAFEALEKCEALLKGSGDNG